MAARELPEMPNGPVMEIHGQRKRFHVPFGLKPLLEEFTREVLRYQPDDVYLFLSQYMQLKLEQKPATEEPKRDSQKRNSGEGDGKMPLTEEELQDLLDDLNLPKDVAEQYATKIQAAFRGFMTRKSLRNSGKALHKDHRKSWEWKKWSWEGPSELKEEELEEFLAEHGVDKDTADKMATKIQAVYRGHKVRKSHAGPTDSENSKTAAEGENEGKEPEEKEPSSEAQEVQKSAGESDAPASQKRKSVGATRKSLGEPRKSGEETQQPAVEAQNSAGEGETGKPDAEAQKSGEIPETGSNEPEPPVAEEDPKPPSPDPQEAPAPVEGTDAPADPAPDAPEQETLET